MKRRIDSLMMILVLTLFALSIAACGGTGNNPNNNSGDAPTRTRAATNAPGGAQPTQDTLDDSENVAPEDTPDANATPDPLDDSAATIDDETPAPAAQPPMQGGLVVLRDSSWISLDDELTYQFCQNNRWEILNADGSLQTNGTYSVKGDMVAMNKGGAISNYKMVWQAADGILEMTADNATLALEYQGKSDCS